MIERKTPTFLNFGVLLAVVAIVFLLLGCGPSAEEQKRNEGLRQLSDQLGEFVEKEKEMLFLTYSFAGNFDYQKVEFSTPAGFAGFIWGETLDEILNRGVELTHRQTDPNIYHLSTKNEAAKFDFDLEFDGGGKLEKISLVEVVAAGRGNYTLVTLERRLKKQGLKRVNHEDPTVPGWVKRKWLGKKTDLSIIYEQVAEPQKVGDTLLMVATKGSVGEKPTTPTAEETFLPSSPKKLDPLKKTRLKEIFVLVMATPGEPTEKTKNEFWMLMAEDGVTDQVAARKNFQDEVGAVLDYPLVFWSDALWAEKTGRPFMSGERETLEARLAASPHVSNFQIEQNHKNMVKIAVGEPVQLSAGPVILTAEMIEAVIENLAGSKERIEELFETPRK